MREYNSLCKVLRSVRPNLIIHMAAQPLVQKSYIDIHGKFEVNLMGTNNLLDIIIKHQSSEGCAVLVITSDKVYENKGANAIFDETCPLHGSDPYSASKSAARNVGNWL